MYPIGRLANLHRGSGMSGAPSRSRRNPTPKLDTMIIDDRVLQGRDAVLAAAGHHPYARAALWRGLEARGYQRDGAVLWVFPPEHSNGGDAIGPAEPAIEICAALVADGVLRPGQSLHLPRHGRELLSDRLTVSRHGDWTSSGPARPRPSSRTSSGWYASPPPTTRRWKP